MHSHNTPNERNWRVIHTPFGDTRLSWHVIVSGRSLLFIHYMNTDCHSVTSLSHLNVCASVFILCCLLKKNSSMKSIMYFADSNQQVNYSEKPTMWVADVPSLLTMFPRSLLLCILLYMSLLLSLPPLIHLLLYISFDWNHVLLKQPSEMPVCKSLIRLHSCPLRGGRFMPFHY